MQQGGLTQMKEVSRIVVGSNQLRIMKNDESKWCEIFEFGNWKRLTPTELHQLSFDSRIDDWLNSELLLAK
jgi:hypothetical protein